MTADGDRAGTDIVERPLTDHIKQLRQFVAFERARTGRVHVADWALAEIERLRAELAACRTAALEEAAKACERFIIGAAIRIEAYMAQQCANAVRALKEKP